MYKIDLWLPSKKKKLCHIIVIYYYYFKWSHKIFFCFLYMDYECIGHMSFCSNMALFDKHLDDIDQVLQVTFYYRFVYYSRRFKVQTWTMHVWSIFVTVFHHSWVWLQVYSQNVWVFIVRWLLPCCHPPQQDPCLKGACTGPQRRRWPLLTISWSVNQRICQGAI